MFARIKKKLLEESAVIRHYLWKYRSFVAIGLLALVTVDVLEILPPLFLKDAVDAVKDHRPVRILYTLALYYLGVSFIQSLCRYGWRMYLIRASIFAGRDIRQKYTHHLFGLSTSFFDRSRIGDLMSFATNDVEAVRMAIGNGVLVFADAMFYFMSVPIAMYLLSPKLTLLAFVPLPIIPLLVLRNKRQLDERFEKVQASFGKVSALVQESLNGVRTVKAFAKENVLLSRIRDAGHENVLLNLDLARVQTAFGPTLDFTMSLGLVLLLYLGGGAVMGAGPLGGAVVTLGTFVAFQRYIQKLVWPMAALGMSINYFQRSKTSWERLQSIFSLKTDTPSGRATISSQARGEIEFRNLSFRFPGSDQLILRDISLKIEAGERVAFLGEVGSGKSSLLSLLPRLYPVERGMIWVDGVDINDWPIEELRKRVGYVSQDIFLFSESVSENVAFGLHEWLERGAEGPSIEQATKLAAVHEDILGLTGSYRTRLGERGVNLSGGQKQRLTIARALAKNPPILVLDDALSSVDFQTEEKILRGLRSRPGRNTELIAAHRISTIQDADRVVVLDRGQIRQIGKHDQLVADRRGTYRIFFEQQRLKEELETYSWNLNPTST